jgi:adenylate cyclase
MDEEFAEGDIINLSLYNFAPMNIITRWLLLFVFCLSQGELLAQHDEDLSTQAEFLDILLERAARHNDRDSAKAIAKEAYEIAKNSQYHGAFCRAALMLANTAKSEKRPLDAVRYYVEAAGRTATLQDTKLVNQVHLGLADLYMREQVYKSAIENYQRALAQDPENEQILQLLGDAWLAERVFDSVDVYYSRLIDQYQRRGDYASEVKYYRKLIDIYEENGNIGMVLSNYLRIDNVLDKRGTQSERAVLYNNLGKTYLEQGDYQNALLFLKKADLQCQYTECAGRDAMMINMSVCLFNLGQTRESIDFLVQGIRILEKKKDYSSLAHAEEMLSGVYLNSNDLYNAQRHNTLARSYAEKARDPEARARAYERAADIYFELYAYDEAIQFYKQFLALTDSLRSQDKEKISRQGELKSELERTERETRGLLFSQEIKNRALAEAAKDKTILEAVNRALASEAKQKEEALVQLQEREKLTVSELRVRSLEALQAQKDLRAAAQQQKLEQQQRETEAQLHAEALDRKEAEANAMQQKGELNQLQSENEIKALKLRDNENFRKYTLLGGGLSLVILGLLAAGWAWSRRSNRRLNTQNKAIEEQKALIQLEQQRSEQLLLNILPQEVADELKQTGVATPRVYEQVSVLFTDFESFTSLTSDASPERVLEELNTCFHAFDLICDKYGLEKIKTIGDAFMAAAGVPQFDAESAINATKAGLEMAKFLETRKETEPNALLHRMRIGIHTGQVVAGVVGKNKFAYDIWGDAVNTAARMEEFGEPGRVNVSEITAKLIKSEFELKDRGFLPVHNKGDMRMYFVVK